MAKHSDDLAGVLAENVRQLRRARGRTQKQMSDLAEVPRATWAHLESGAANPTLAVLRAVAGALSVSLEELLAPPRASGRLYPKADLERRERGGVEVRQLLPDPIPGMSIERLALSVGARMIGVPHTTGTREYLTCERGRIALVASGERFELAPGDVVSFRGDQRHSYECVGSRAAVGYSVVVLVSPLTLAP